MNLATGCSSCGTMFRVVEDQLKVSDGWVRCGHCHAVFNALESLVDLDLEPLPAPPAPPRSPDPFEAPAAAAPRVPEPFETPVAAAPAVTGPAPLPPVHEPDVDLDLVLPGDPETRPDAVPVPSSTLLAPPPDTVALDVAAAGSTAPSVLDAPLPAFAAERPAFTRGPTTARRERRAGGGGVRGIGALVALLLGLVLVGQWAYHERAMLAARYPALQPALASGCAVLGCRIELPLSIDDLSVESTGLAQTALSGAFRLTIALRNRAAVALAVPAIELSLSDTGGQLIARKVLMPKDFEAPPAALPPGGDTTLQALLATPGGQVSGYTVEVYYP